MTGYYVKGNVARSEYITQAGHMTKIEHNIKIRTIDIYTKIFQLMKETKKTKIKQGQD